MLSPVIELFFVFLFELAIINWDVKLNWSGNASCKRTKVYIFTSSFRLFISHLSKFSPLTVLLHHCAERLNWEQFFRFSASYYKSTMFYKHVQAFEANGKFDIFSSYIDKPGIPKCIFQLHEKANFEDSSTNLIVF